MVPSFPAIRTRLSERSYSISQIYTVMDALEIVEDTTRVNCGLDTVKQIDEYSLLGLTDSCDHSDIAFDALLQVVILVPSRELKGPNRIDVKRRNEVEDTGIRKFLMERRNCNRKKIVSVEKEENTLKKQEIKK